MKLSIVIPVYNSEKILDKLLKTIKNAIPKKNYCIFVKPIQGGSYCFPIKDTCLSKTNIT